MEDKEIVSLYWKRDERAVSETSEKYGAYCYAIAYNILSSPEDAEESVNDTWVGAWESMPPHKPDALSAFLGKITRRISLKRWRNRRAAKRGGGVVELALEELKESIPAGQAVEDEAVRPQHPAGQEQNQPELRGLLEVLPEGPEEGAGQGPLPVLHYFQGHGVQRRGRPRREDGDGADCPQQIEATALGQLQNDPAELAVVGKEFHSPSPPTGRAPVEAR